MQTFHFVSDEYLTGSEARVYHINSQFSPPPPPPSFSFSPGVGCSTKNQLSFTGTRLPQTVSPYVSNKIAVFFSVLGVISINYLPIE